MPTIARQIRELMRLAEPSVSRLFLAAVKDIRDKANLTLIRNALRTGGVESVLTALDIDPAPFSKVAARVLQVYGDTGTAVTNGTAWRYPNGQRAVVRYNALSPRAETYARQWGSGWVTQITEDTRAAAANIIADGYAFNLSADSIARDLVGRVGANGARVGGIIGLNLPQSETVKNMRYNLRYGQYQKVLNLTRRDKRFDKLLMSGKPLTEKQIDLMVTRYQARLLESRGRTIARTELANAIEMGKYEAWRQGLEKTGIPEEFIVRTWEHTGRGLNDRPDHVNMNGKTVSGMIAPFVFPDGAMMRFPHDQSLNAGAKHVINCMCGCRYSLDKKRLAAWRG